MFSTFAVVDPTKMIIRVD